MLNLTGDVRYALRQFRLSPVFAAAAILTLALGIGGTTAIFTLMDAIMLRSLPVSDPGRLYRIGDGDSCCETGSPQDQWGMFSFRLYERLKAETPEFAELTAFQSSPFERLSVRRQGAETPARPLCSEYVTGNYFSTLGVRAFGGRVFTADDDHPGSPPVAVISYRAWQAVYGGDTSMAGSTFVIEGHPFTVTGIAPAGFFGETLRGDPQPRLAALYRELEGRLNRLPGVRGSGLALYNPLTNNWSEFIMVAGHPLPKMDENAGASWDRVSTDYLPNLGVRMLRGRAFTNADNENTAPVAIVNQAFVKRFFKPGEDPLEQHFGLDLPENAGTFRIIGVAQDAKFAWAIRRPALPMFYVPLAQYVNYKNAMSGLEKESHFISGILLITNRQPGELEPVLTKALAEVDPNLTIVSVRTLEQQLALLFDRNRAVASLAGLFGVVALLLAAVGLYGVTAYAVARRTTEIGIRMALGAGRAKVVRLILRGASIRVLLGLLLGIPLAIGGGRLIAAELYGVSSWDPLALGLAAGMLALCAFFAALIPARRAASISPVEALRTE